MLRRRAFTVLELLVVVAVVLVLLGLMLPAVQAARAVSRSVACSANLKQIGVAIASFHAVRQVLPRARLCPAPWQGGADVCCQQVNPADTYTGPNEIWWAPYDNRVPPTSPALPDFDPGHFLLAPFAEANPAIFHCPEGFDRTSGSPTLGAIYQVSYALSQIIGGPQGMKLGTISSHNGTSKVLLAWDHDRLPTCSDDNGAPVYPFNDSLTNSEPHYHYPADRHQDTFNALYCDGHVVSLRTDSLQLGAFYVQQQPAN